MDWKEKIISEGQLSVVRRHRADKYIYKNINKLLTEQCISEGWELCKELKHKNKMKKIKPLAEQFEDEVWSLFASLGFKSMNCDRQLKIPYDPRNTNLTKQIDVFAMDAETVLLVECKCAESGRRGNFKTEIEAINGYKEKIFSEIKKAYPDKSKRKLKYVFATKNYELGEQDLGRLEKFNIQYFDSKAIAYYSELVKHLGEAARFQLLGQLFEGQRIGSMDNKIPAIRGEMGGLVYYSFSMQPESLLKIAYVLHRTDANRDMMPTYQRIIKKPRLKEIRKFIDGGGFFPNSIIISIDTNGKRLSFDYASLKGDTDATKIGILHLPQKYRTAFIIDGQHRLYGYSDSKYISKDAIPVVAFENLDKNKQVDLFMQINENQKSVPKNLQNTLIADLLWSDNDWNKRRQALRARIAMDLGEKPASPLYERIRIGENELSPTRNITMQAIQDGLYRSDFLSIYGKDNSIIFNGTFDKGENEQTLKSLYRYLELCFSYIKENLPEEWDKGAADEGILTINNSVLAIIRILNDIVNLLIEKNVVQPFVETPEKFYEESKYYLDPLIHYINTISDEDRVDIKQVRGSGAMPKVWRMYQIAINKMRDDFCPEGLGKWIDDNTQKYNDESFRMLREIEQFLNKDFRDRLKAFYGAEWLMAGVPKKVYDTATSMAADKDYEEKLARGTTDPWDCLFIINYRDIAISGSNWSEVFEKYYTKPGEEKISGGKNAKTVWMVKLNDIRKSIVHSSYSVTKEQYDFLLELHEWLIS